MLVALGKEVIVLARAGSSVAHLAPLIDAGAVRLVRTELGFAPGTHEPLPALAEAVRQAGVVYHCAGCSTDWASLATYTQGNVTSTEAMLAAAAGSLHLVRFVHVSTTDVYGYPAMPGNESVPVQDTGLPYNHTKILGEQAAWQASANGMPVTILRPATIYGPRGTAFVTDIAKLLRERTMAYVDGGGTPGGFVYVDDVCEAMLAAAQAPEATGKAYNLSSRQGETWKQYCVSLAAALGLPAPWIDLPFTVGIAIAGLMEAPHRYLRVPGRPLLTRHAVYLLGRNQEFPSEAAQKDLGYAPRVTLEDGIARSVAWLEASRSGKSALKSEA